LLISDLHILPAAELEPAAIFHQLYSEGGLVLTKNQALMGLKKMKKSQKQVELLTVMIRDAGDELDCQDEEYIGMLEHLEACSRELQQTAERMGQYAAHNTRG